MLTTRHPWYVKALTLAVVAVLSAASLSSCSFSNTKTIYAQFRTAAGLFVGNDVGVLGVPIGTVAAVKPEGQYVLVTLQINSDQPIPAGAAAVVVSRSVATDRYVELTPVYTSGPQMQSGTTITADRTQTPVEFDQVLSTIGSFANQIGGSGADAGAIGRFLTTTSNTLKGRGTLINQAIGSLGAAVNGIAQQRSNATSTLVALDKLTSTLASNQGTIRQFVQQVARASALLAAERTNFKTAISSATEMINVVARFARDNHTQITKAVNQTNGALHTLVAKSPQVAEILRELPLASENLELAINPRQGLIVRGNLSSLLPVVSPLVFALCQAIANLNVCQSIGFGTLTNPLGALNQLLGGLL